MSIRISNGGKTIRATGADANALFKAMTEPQKPKEDMRLNADAGVIEFTSAGAASIAFQHLNEYAALNAVAEEASGETGWPENEPDSQCNCHPHYTTDPAAAFEVLKKCVQAAADNGYEINFGFWKHFESGNWMVCSSYKRGFQTRGDTLEQAICLFAQHLFTPKPN